MDKELDKAAEKLYREGKIKDTVSFKAGASYQSSNQEVISISFPENDKIVLIRENGNTYTSKSEELMDFLFGTKNFTLQSSRMVSLESELRELLEKWALENTIKKRFESNAVDRNNDRAAQMWRHKREGVERCVNDVKKVLEKYSIDIKKDYQND